MGTLTVGKAETLQIFCNLQKVNAALEVLGAPGMREGLGYSSDPVNATCEGVGPGWRKKSSWVQCSSTEVQYCGWRMRKRGV